MKKISLFGSKGRIFASAFIFALSVSFCACSVFSNLEVPEKISVKTDAKFSVALGEKHINMNKIFGDGLQESISSAEDLDVFTYVPDKNDDTLQYLLHSNIYNFDLDIGEMLGSLNMDDMLSGEGGIEVDKKIQIPEVKSPEPMEWGENPVKGTASPIATSRQWQIDNKISFGEVKYIKTAVVKNNASIEIKVAKPAGTNGVSLELESLTISGKGLNFTKDDFKSVTNNDYLLFQKLDFAKDEDRRTLNFLQSGDIEIKGTINVIIAEGATCGGLSTEINVNMKEIEKATADFSDLVNFNNSGSKFPESMLKCVGNVTFGEEGSHYKHEAGNKLSNVKSEGVGIKCEIVNSLPEGNDIDITITSKALNITAADSKDWKIQSTGNENSKTENWCVFKDIDFSDKSKFNPDNPPPMDFNIKLSDKQELKNLKFGEEYSFSIKNSQFVFDWDSADVKLGELSKDPIDDYNDLSSFSKDAFFGDLDGVLGEFVKKYIEFGDNVKAYFYAQKPASGLDIGDITLDGTVKMTYTLDGENKSDNILDKGFELSSPMKWKPNDKKEFTTDLEKDKKYIADYDMSKVLKDGVENLKIEYNLEIGGESETKVYKLALDNLEEGASTSISIDAAIVFPLELKIKKDATLDILKVADFDEDKTDLFGREDISSDNEEYADYLDYIRFEYNLKNNVIKGFDFKVEIDDSHSGDENYSGIHAIFDNKKMQFSTEDTKKILTRRFMPKILLKFDEEKDTDIKISRSGLASEKSFSFSPVIAIKLNDDSPICITDILN